MLYRAETRIGTASLPNQFGIIAAHHEEAVRESDCARALKQTWKPALKRLMRARGRLVTEHQDPQDQGEARCKHWSRAKALHQRQKLR